MRWKSVCGRLGTRRDTALMSRARELQSGYQNITGHGICTMSIDADWRNDHVSVEHLRCCLVHRNSDVFVCAKERLAENEKRSTPYTPFSRKMASCCLYAMFEPGDLSGCFDLSPSAVPCTGINMWNVGFTAPTLLDFMWHCRLTRIKRFQ